MRAHARRMPDAMLHRAGGGRVRARARRVDLPSRKRVAYVVTHYPLISHTFILREVLALRRLGVAVEMFAIHKAVPEEVLTDEDAAEAAATTSVLPLGYLPFVRAHLRALWHSPAAYTATLKYALAQSPRGAKAHLWQVFYFAEAVVVWSGCAQRSVHHLHAHFANAGADVAWLACELGRRIDPATPWHWSFTMHGCIEFFEVSRFNLLRKVSAAGLVVCISEFTRAQLMALCDPADWPKLRVVHCGVELDRYRPVGQRGAHRGPLRILSVGRLSHEKGQPMLLAAVAELQQRGVSVRLTLVGDGPMRSDLEEDAQRLGIEGIVTFTGSVGQDVMPAMFQDADIFCQPSFAEGIPVVLMEAMASGLPVVSSRLAGIPELITHGESGLLVPPGRPDLLADALRDARRIRGDARGNGAASSRRGGRAVRRERRRS